MKPRLDTVDRPARILIVDDERTNRQLLEAMLAPEGFAIYAAGSGEEALALVSQQPPDLILLDVMLPGLDGCQLAFKLKADVATKHIPIIMVTAQPDRDARILGLSAGAEEFLTKPVDRSELRMRVTNLLRLKAYGDYHDQYSQMLEDELGVRAANLLESERLYRSTFDAAPVGIVHMGLDGQWLRINQHLCDLLGYSQGELQSASVQDLIQLAAETTADGETESTRHLSAGVLDSHVVTERRYRRHDGSDLWARVSVSAHRIAAGPAQYFISVIEDITEQRTLEAKLRQASNMEAIGSLASGVAHDFNNLLSIVLSYSELLVEQLSEGDPRLADLEEIRGAGLRAATLTDQLLAFGRQQVLQPKIVDLVEIVNGMGTMLRRVIGEDVELTVIASPAPRRIKIDPGQLEHVIMNLAVNARDSMPRGGKLTIETSEVVREETYAAEHTGVSPGPHIMLAVSDTGVGMDHATQARIFDPFAPTKGGAADGTGLGLATVFGIVEQSGGAMWVSSESGKGTTFKVYFPMATAAAPRVAHSLAPTPREVYGSETILLVEDEERVRMVVRTILRNCGYDVLESQNAGEALLLCEKHGGTIHLLLTDVVMPRMNGRELATRLLLVRPAMKVLYMSGHAGDAFVRVLDPRVGFLRKPVTPGTLARKVREVLDATSPVYSGRVLGPA